MKAIKNYQCWGAFLLVGLSLAGPGLSTGWAQANQPYQTIGKTLSAAKIGVTTSQLMVSVNRMMDKLNAMRFTGDPDFDYVLFTRNHHLAEIELAQEAEKALISDSLKQMARTLISRKQQEVDQLEDALRQIRPNRANQAFVQAQKRKLAAMKLNFQADTLEKKLTGKVDEDYTMIMLEHQRDAIDMTQDYLQYGKNQTLRSVAQQILANARKDSEQFKGLKKQ